MKTILVATDFSDYSRQAAKAAVQLARQTGARIVVMHNIHTLMNWESLSVDEQKRYPETWKKTAEAEDQLTRFVKSNLFNNVKVQKLLTHGVTYEEIVAQGQRLKADMIVIGSHGNVDSEKVFIGSNIQKVMREAVLPVLTIKTESSLKRWKKVVFAANFEENMAKPFAQIKKIILDLGAVVHLVYVNTPSGFKDERSIQSMMEAFTSKHPDLKFELAVYNHYDLDRGILEYAEACGGDCIALITHKHLHAPRYLISVTESVAFHTTIPLLSLSL